MKWIFSTLAFFLTAFFVSGITTHVFLSKIDSGFSQANENIKLKSNAFAEENLKQFYSQLDFDQKSQIEQIKSLTPEQRKLALGEQCLTIDLKDAPFCNPQFISGKITFDDAINENSKKQFQEAMTQALNEMKNKLSKYSSYPLLLISSVCAVLGILFYCLANKTILGIQTFAGNVSWLSFLSAVSFKFMPATLERVVSSLSQSQGSDIIIASLTKDIIFDWLNPAINSAFVASMWFAVISLLIWAIFKIARKYSVDVTPS